MKKFVMSTIDNVRQFFSFRLKVEYFNQFFEKQIMCRIKGFSLVELSIVLIIIGLVLGGVAGGSKLIEQAKIKNLISEIKQYEVAIRTFELTYDAIPGDLKNGGQYFASATCVDDTYTGSPTTFCNGNADNTINWYNNSRDETSVAWLHLGAAQLIAGTFTGNKLESGKATFPRSRYGSDVGYYIESSIKMYIGSKSLVNDGTLGALPVNFIYTIDKSIDDGKANTGRITCDTTGCHSSGVYQHTNTSKSHRYIYDIKK